MCSYPILLTSSVAVYLELDGLTVRCYLSNTWAISVFMNLKGPGSEEGPSSRSQSLLTIIIFISELL